MASQVDIANYALNLLGASNISSFDENSKAGRLVNQFYEGTRDSVFRSHPWNCLIRRAELAQETDTPAFGYAYQYALPTNPYCLRVLEFSNGTLSYPQDNMTSNSGGPVFAIEGRKLLTDEGTVKIKYVAKITDPQEYDVSLTQVIAARLAANIGYAITGSNSIVQMMYAKYDEEIKEARLNDATEGAPQRLEASDFIESRL
jgi:hypothetical protein